MSRFSLIRFLGAWCLLHQTSSFSLISSPPTTLRHQHMSTTCTTLGATPSLKNDDKDSSNGAADRRTFLATGAALASAAATFGVPPPAQAVGPVKLGLTPLSYSAAPCPPSKPIPGQQAMRGMRGLCVTVVADLKDASPKDLQDVGVYGFVVDGESGDSVLANNPDLSTDAGQFAMVESITPSDKRITFEFVAAVPTEKNIGKYENGIGPLDFVNLKVISFPGGQQYGAINPCEMNEFSDECEAWENENGPYERKNFMVKPNERTKGR